MFPFRQLCVYCCRLSLTVTIKAVYANSPSNVTMENMFLYRKQNSNHRKGSGALCQLNSYVKYPAGSSYHLTRLVFMKTSSHALSPPSSHVLRQDVVLSLLEEPSPTAGHRCSSQLRSLLTRDARKGDPHSNGLCRFTAPWLCRSI